MQGELHSISAYILCYNNEDTIAKAVQSILLQTIKIDKVLVIDDGSNDKSFEIIRSLKCSLIRFPKNFGRGFARAKAMETLTSDFILCCDATNELAPDFLSECLKKFSSNDIVSVSGTLNSRREHMRTVSGRWRSRHLFKENQDIPPMDVEDMLITYGTLVRRNPVLEVGNYDKRLKHNEDQELGKRLNKNGYLMKASSKAIIYPIKNNSVAKVLERYWRWNCGPEEDISLKSYFHACKNSIKPMAQLDLRDKDYSSLILSLIIPHYCFIKTMLRKVINL